MIGIYTIENEKGSIYVGQSVDLERRFRTYKKLNCKSQIKLYRSLLKYGFENHTIRIVDICDVDNLNIRERHYQDLFSSVNKGLNCKATTTKSKSGYLSDETKKRMSDSGKLMTEETKRKISESNKGKKMSDSAKLKMSISKKGVKLSETHKMKISKATKGRVHSVESKKKMSISKKGMPTDIKNRAIIILDVNSGVFYESITELSIILSLKGSVLSNHLNMKHKNNKYKQYKKV
jgi:group I intron endonuclease